jgi:hypothetical protein
MRSDRNKAQKDWRALAEGAPRETDPGELLRIIRELCDAIDHRAAPQQAKRFIQKNDNSVDD